MPYGPTEGHPAIHCHTRVCYPPEVYLKALPRACTFESHGFAMIQVTSSSDGPQLMSSTSALPVYLDTWAMIDLAKHYPSRRKRFVDAVRAGADLLFSTANVVELTGPKEKSFDVVKSFLDEIGPYWVPIHRTPSDVVECEAKGIDPPESFSSSDFMDAYFRDRTAGDLPGSQKIIDLGPDFFRLGAVMDWIAEDDTLPKLPAKWDDFLRTLPSRRVGYERDPSVLDQKYRTFNPSQPATFVYGNLTKTLIIESKSHQVKKGDGMDFWHAVMGSAFARFATLDKNWKRRVEAFPKPNRLARIYSPLQLDQMVMDIEHELKHRGAPR